MVLTPLLRLFELLSPQLNAKIAYYFLANPRQRKRRDFEEKIIAEANRGFLDFKGFKIATYEWGKGPHTALLVHGWEGSAANFGAIVPLLVEKGYRVTAFDAPSHGESTRKPTSFLDYAALIGSFLERNAYDLIMSHSMGSVMTLFALHQHPGVSVKDLFILTTPDRLEERLQQVIDALGLGDRTKQALLKWLEIKTGYDPLKLNASEFARELSVERAVFIHDQADRVIPIKWSQAVQQNLNNSVLIPIEDTGHFRMLWSEVTLRLLDEKIRS